jgi:hypothetical protein
MSSKSRTRLLVISLFIAWCFDQLFWAKMPGVSLLIFAGLCLTAGLYLSFSERQRPSLASLALLPLVLVFALLSFVRLEPLSLVLCYALTLLGLILVSMTWLGGRWWQYTLTDYLANGLRWLGLSLIRPGPALASLGRRRGAPGGEAAQFRPLLSIFMGLLLALPVVSLLAALLSAADPIFAARLEDFLQILNIELLDEYIIRLFYISLLAYLLAGALLYALVSSCDERVTGEGKSWLTPFVGWIEASILLASVNLLFVAFVGIQFRYFFGGTQNISYQGFTYAEYARRGFGELVAVALISLLLFLGLSFITRRTTDASRRLFSGFGMALVILVAVILVSAFLRLSLYENAYGFTRLRTYTHIFMVWLGLLLLVTVVLEGLGRLRFFALAALLSALGFAFSLNVLNVDGFIVRQNVIRAVNGEDLDLLYLASLSDDAVPAMFSQFHSPQVPEGLRVELGWALACQAKLGEREREVRSWPEFHYSHWRAASLYAQHAGELAEYDLHYSLGIPVIILDGAELSCSEERSMD